MGPLAGLNISGLNGTPTATGMGAGAAGASFASSGVSARDNEDERRRRIEAILGILRQRPGMVSEEGLERLAKRTGLECLWEDGMGVEGGGRRTLSIAGNNVLVDVDFLAGDRVEKVGLSFPSCKTGPVLECAEKGARVLQRDLQMGHGHERGYRMLEPFAANLERLARLDKLSVDGANCFEAVGGVYMGLRRVFESEVGKVRRVGAQGMEEEEVEREVLCKLSGRPRMHARRRVGLSVEYWMERRLVPGKKRKRDGDVKMEGVKEPEAMQPEGHENDQPRIWSATVECEASPAELYPSIRVSDTWVSANLDNSQDNQDESLTGSSSIDWLDPPPTLTPSPLTADTIAVDPGVSANGKPPDVRFVARLEPPVVVPLQTAIDIYGSVGVTIPQDSIRPTTYEELLLPDLKPGSPTRPSEDVQLVVERQIRTYDKTGQATTHQHTNTLYSQKSEFGRLVENIPFSHPRQLLAIFPVLRQWALVGSILRRSFTADNVENKKSDEEDPNQTSAQNPSNSTAPSKPRTPAEDLALLLAPTEPPPSTTDSDPDAAIPVDISLSTHPTPKIALLFDVRGALASATFEILANGEICASDVVARSMADASRMGGGGGGGGGEEGEEEGRARVLLAAERVARVLAIGEDVGVLVGWVGSEGFDGRRGGRGGS